MRIRHLGMAVIAAALLAPATASAVIDLTIQGPIEGNTIGPQSSSNPCVIAGTTCQQPASMGYNNFTSTGSIDQYDMYSTTPTANVANGVEGTPYTVSQLVGALGNTSFVIAIDVNTTGAASEQLILFEVIINGQVEYVFNGPFNIGNINNQGNGYADYTLNTVSLAGFNDTDTVLFHAVWSNAVDGAESFFLVPGSRPPQEVPEPASVALLGLALAGLGLTIALRSRKV